MPQTRVQIQSSSEDLLWAGLALPALTEEELARQRNSTGDKVHLHRGVWWQQLKSSFCTPCYMYRLVDHIDSWPQSRHAIAGFMHLASLNSPSNGNFSAIVRDSVDEYSIQNLSTKTRNHVRRALARLQIRPVERLETFLSDGHDVYASWHQRVQWGRDKSDRGRFEAWMIRVFGQAKRLVLGAYLGNKLVAFMLPHAIERTAFMAFVAAHTDYLKLRPNDALNHSFLNIARQTPGVQIADFGPLCSKTSLNEFKLHYAATKQFPSYTWINPLIRPVFNKWIDRRYPWVGI